MSPKDLSRRNFFVGMIKATFASTLAPLFALVPEAKAVLANGGPIGRVPKDTRIDRLTRAATEDAVAVALSATISKQLFAKLIANYAVDTSNSIAFNATWVDKLRGPTVVPVAVLPFKDGQGGEAYLFYSPMDGGTQSVLVELKANRKSLTEAEVYQISNGTIAINRVALTRHGNPETMTHLCNQDCMIQCLQLYGCSGLGLTLCIVAILACPFSIISCLGAWACTLYCGGAFSICWTNFCCAEH